MASRTFKAPNPYTSGGATVIQDGANVTACYRVGQTCRVDVGMADGNGHTINSGEQALVQLPDHMKPTNNAYFPVLYRIVADSIFYNAYGAIKTDGKAYVTLPSSANVRQLIYGITYSIR